MSGSTKQGLVRIVWSELPRSQDMLLGEIESLYRERSEVSTSGVAYDEKLAQRIRDLVAGERSVVEKKMFGGLAFLINGNMSVAASGQGGLLVRVDPDNSDDLVKKPGVESLVMRGRPMAGWLRVDADSVRTKRQLSSWVDRGVSFARSLPPKS